MTFDEAKESLKTGFKERQFELADEHARELFFKLGTSRLIKLSETDIQNYADTKSTNPAFEKKPDETSLITQNYREQMMQYLHPMRARFLPPRDINILFGEENAETPYVQISQASPAYIWSNLFEEAFFELVIERLRFRAFREGNVDFFETIYKPLTVKVYNLKENSVETAIKTSTKLIEGCMFSYSSLKDNPIGLVNDWPRRRIRREREFEFGETHPGNNFNLPSVKFNPHLVRFYQLATSTDVESYKFLSYYHILEYHFVSISDQILYDKLSRRINDLKFRTTATNLDRVIQDVNDHRSETDETEMLKNVLSKLVYSATSSELIKKQIPLIKFLAEKVTVATSE